MPSYHSLLPENAGEMVAESMDAHAYFPVASSTAVSTMMLAHSRIAISFAWSAAYLLKSRQPSLRGLPSSQTGYGIAHQAATVALPTRILAIMLGGYWANSAWGWEPKETTYLLTWLTLAEYFQMQGLRISRGLRASWVLATEFGSIIFKMIAVNFSGVGPRAYA